jgi:hypothetical protein
MDETHLLSIYNLRRLAGAKRQARHERSLADLHSALALLVPPKTHPYALTHSDYRALEKVSAFMNTCRGSQGKVGGQYCYRVTAIGKIRQHTENLQSRHLNLRNISNDDAFRYLSREFRTKGDWLPLGRFIGGKQSGPRGITWWTTMDLPGRNLLCSCHRLGLPNEYVAPRAIVLRCPTDFVRDNALAFVPSSIDAFFSDIFQPVPDDTSTIAGATIDLEDSTLLKSGVEEYVLPPLDIDDARIQFYPVDQNSSASHNVFRDSISWPLQQFYERL